MFIVQPARGHQAPLGAACHDDRVVRISMPRLTELERGSVGCPFYRHSAPSGALAHPAGCETSRLSGSRSAVRQSFMFCVFCAFSRLNRSFWGKTRVPPRPSVVLFCINTAFGHFTSGLVSRSRQPRKPAVRAQGHPAPLTRAVAPSERVERGLG